MRLKVDAASDAFLDGLRTLNQRLQRVERQVAGGKRLETAADDPDAVSSLMNSNAGLARLEQTQANLSRFKSEADAAEGALQQAVKLFNILNTLNHMWQIEQ